MGDQSLAAAPSSQDSRLLDSKRAWLAAACVALINGVGFGTAYTFGTFFGSMAAEFETGNGATALIFGVTLLFFFGFGLVSGPLSDRFGPRPLLIIGGVIFVAGLLATSRATNLVVALLSYGIGVGVGGGMFVAPLTASVGRLFVVRRPAALSLVAVGNGVGILILVPLSQWMISRSGWRSAYVLLAAIGGVAVVVASLGIVSQRAPVSHQKVTATDIIQRRGFIALFLASLLMSVGLFISFAFIQPFAIGNGVAETSAARLFGTVGLASIVGRIGLSSMVRKLGALRLMQVTLMVQLAAYLVWYFADGSVSLLTCFVVLLGVSYGGFVSLAPEALIRLVGLAAIGRSMGLMFLSFGLGGLIGPPFAGWLDEGSSDGQAGTILLTIALSIAAFVASLTIRADFESAGTE